MLQFSTRKRKTEIDANYKIEKLKVINDRKERIRRRSNIVRDKQVVKLPRIKNVNKIKRLEPEFEKDKKIGQINVIYPHNDVLNIELKNKYGKRYNNDKKGYWIDNTAKSYCIKCNKLSVPKHQEYYRNPLTDSLKIIGLCDNLKHAVFAKIKL